MNNQIHYKGQVFDRFRPDFPSKLEGVDFQTLEESQNAIFGLSEKLALIYFNPGWYEFAGQNDVKPDVLAISGLGTLITDLIKGVEIRKFYTDNYKRALETKTSWQHEYECSSANQFRKYHQKVYPFKNGKGLIVCNSEMISMPMEKLGRNEFDPVIKRYKQNTTGLISQCTNCRKVKRAGEDVWDWVPAWVEQSTGNTCHSICTVCRDYYRKYH